MAKMTDDDLAAMVDARISDARQFDQSDLSDQRSRAIRYYDGQVDIPSQEGRSSVVSSDVADVHGWILPQLVRVFTGSDKLAVYEPETPEEEGGAKQATDGINFIFMQECEGFRIVKDSMHDGLLHGNGPIKAWWEGSPEYKVETIRGLTEEELDGLISEPGVEEVLELTEYLVGPNGDPIDGEEAGVDDAY
jgi:hypothetical protein